MMGRLVGLVATVAVLVAGVAVITAVHLLPHIRNPFAESTTVRNQPALLKSISALSQLGRGDIQVSPGRTAVTVRLPEPRLEPATLNVRQSYVFAQQQGLLNRIGGIFSGNPGSQQQVYIAAQQKIQAAASHSPLLTQAKSNTRSMLTSMLHSLGFSRVRVIFGTR
jgi:hypothetical protein